LRVARILFDNEMDMPEDSNKEGQVFSCRGFVDFVSESEERSREKTVQTTTKNAIFFKMIQEKSHTTLSLFPPQVENGLAQGKWLLYLTDPVEISPPGIGQCFLNPRHVNFLGLRKRTEDSAAASEAARQPPPPPKSAPVPAYSNSFSSYSVKDGPSMSSEIEDKLFLSRTVDMLSSSSYSYSSSSSRRTSWIDRTVVGERRTSEQDEEGEEVYSARLRRDTERVDVAGSVERVRRATEHVDLADSVGRVRRATEHVVEPDRVLDSEGRVARVVVFDCGRETAKCLTISCSIPALPRGAHAIVRLR
jgi:hypothetical protein